jgi:hypothetical protein
MNRIIFISFIIALLSSCSYSVYSTGYPHLKTIAIIPFQNSTTEYQLENDLFLDLSERFQQDGRLSLVTFSSDCQLEGKILDYSNKIFSYNSEGIEQYQIKILFTIIFTDLKKNNILMKNDALVLSEEYSSNDENAEFSTEEGARKKIYKDLFDMILRETLEQW